MESVSGWLQMILNAIGTAHPVMLFLALALLPLVGVPASVLWIAAGVRLGTLPAFAFCAVALLVNLYCRLLAGTLRSAFAPDSPA